MSHTMYFDTQQWLSNRKFVSLVQQGTISMSFEDTTPLQQRVTQAKKEGLASFREKSWARIEVVYDLEGRFYTVNNRRLAVMKSAFPADTLVPVRVVRYRDAVHSRYFTTKDKGQTFIPVSGGIPVRTALSTSA
jgi:hypothetical protein